MSVSLQGKPRLIEFVYEFYLKNFGVLSIAEKKLIIFLTSVQKKLDKPRVNLFGKFIGLVPCSVLLHEEFIFYLKTVNFLFNKNCYKDKRRAIIKKSETTGQILLKNPKLSSFFLGLSLLFNKKQIKALKKVIESEMVSSHKDRVFNLDLIVKRTLLFKREQHLPDPLNFQVFKTISRKKSNEVPLTRPIPRCFNFWPSTSSKRSFKLWSVKWSSPVASALPHLLILSKRWSGREIALEIPPICSCFPSLPCLSVKLSWNSTSKDSSPPFKLTPFCPSTRTILKIHIFPFLNFLIPIRTLWQSSILKKSTELNYTGMIFNSRFISKKISMK